MNILTQGHGMPDAIYMARDAIGLKGINMEDEGRDIPAPSELTSIDASAGTKAHLNVSRVLQEALMAKLNVSR